MKLFKGKKSSPVTLQELQTEFNQVLFGLGDINFRKHMLRQQLTELESTSQQYIQKLDRLGKEAKAVNAKMQQEVKDTIAKGEANAPKAD